MASANDTTTLSRLPLDLLAQILSAMAVHDVMNLRRAYKNKDGFDSFLQECDRRLSVQRYLDKYLGNGIEWLGAMSKCFCYISGSRSLEFFVPGSIDESSDWDMYVSGKENMHSFMKYSEALGVKWMSTSELVNRALDTGSGRVVLDDNTFANAAYIRKLRQTVVQRGYTLEVSSIPTLPGKETVLVVHDRSVVVKPSGDANAYGSLNVEEVMQGEITRGGKIMSVQLIREQRLRGLLSVPSLFGFHSTCVQSFLGPHSAHHLYGKMTADRKSHYWSLCLTPRLPDHVLKNNTEKPFRLGHLAPEWRKYEDRGFKYVDTAAIRPWNSGEDRSIQDDENTSVYYPDRAGAPYAVSRMYIRHTSMLHWRQYTGSQGMTCDATRCSTISQAAISSEWFQRRELRNSTAQREPVHIEKGHE